MEPVGGLQPVDAYLTKPFSVVSLVEKLQRARQVW
jgi:hypothetical protein